MDTNDFYVLMLITLICLLVIHVFFLRQAVKFLKVRLEMHDRKSLKLDRMMVQIIQENAVMRQDYLLAEKCRKALVEIDVFEKMVNEKKSIFKSSL